MNISYPSFYKDFRCIAADCPDSCCHEWTVDVDEDAARLYRSLSGDLGDRLRQVLTEDNTMELENNRCPMWQTDGLCRIQAELGHEALCKTCREFPRLTHDYGDFMEYGLELSCPEAARLIFSCDQQLLTEEIPGKHEPEYDTGLMEILKESRQTALRFLETTTLPLNRALIVLLLYGHTVQGAIDGEGSIELNEAECLSLGDQFAGTGDLSSLVEFFEDLELLTDRWEKLLKTAKSQPITNALKPLAIYMIQRYWLQAVSDYDLISRVKLTVSACILVAALGSTPEAAQLFSKEIENNTDNVDALLDGAYTSQALTDANLLGLMIHFAM